MSDAGGEIRRGEKRAVYVTQRLPNGVQGTIEPSPAPTCTLTQRLPNGVQGTIEPSPAPTCTLYDETGAVVIGYGSLAVSGYSSGQANVLQVWYKLDNATNPLSAGIYTLVFSYSVGGVPGGTEQREGSVDIEVLDEPHLPRAAKLCRSRLMETIEQFPDVELFPEIDLMVLEVYGRFPYLDLTGLAGNDLRFFQQAIGLFTAAKLRPGRPKRVPTGDIEGIRTATQQFNFDNESRARVREVEAVEKGWMAEAQVALGKVTLIREYYLANGAWSPFVLAGPTRASLKQGHGETLASSNIRLLTDKPVVDFEESGDYGDD